jgi:hypothetical protein
MADTFSLAVERPTVRATLMAAYVQGLVGLQHHCLTHDILSPLSILAHVGAIDIARNVLDNEFV